MKMKQEELNEILKLHKLWLNGDTNGQRAILTNVDLTGAILIDAILTYAILTNVDLIDADLTNAILTGAILIDVDLTGAILTGAILIDVNLTGAILRNVDLTGAILTGANLIETDLTGANLDTACWPLWCGSFDAIADDRLICQLFHHIAKINTSKCSSVVKYAHWFIFNNWPGKWLANKFCEYRNGVKEINVK